jgi:hypothetical protein
VTTKLNFLFKKNIYIFQKKKKKKLWLPPLTTPNGGLGVVLATPLAPWGWPSHPFAPTATPSFFLKRI